MTNEEEAVPRVERSGQRLVAFYDEKPMKSAHIGVEQLPLARASAFALGGPAVTRVVYVTHPRDEGRLLPFADYEEDIARDKLNEAIRVFTSLGASRIVATANRDVSSRKELRAARGAVGAGVAHSSGSAYEVAFDHRGTGGAPIDPRPLLYPDEPGFAAACEGVLRLGGRRYKIEIFRTSQYGLDGELALRLKSAGFTLGIGGARSTSNRFVIEAVFGPNAASELDEVVEAAAPVEATKSGQIMRRLRRPIN